MNADETLYIMFGSYNLFAYCINNPVNYSDCWGNYITVANIVGAIVGGIIGAVGGYYLSKWLAEKIGLKGWKKKLFIAGLSTLITASGATIGYFIGPYISSCSTKVLDSLKGFVEKNCCFVEGTKVLTEFGYVGIESVNIGDFVYSRNLYTGEKELKRVLAIYERKTDCLVHIFLEDEEIITTVEHPFWVNQVGWVCANELSIGTELCNFHGDVVVVIGIYYEVLDDMVAVYNIEVEEWHNYFIGCEEILVHNDCSWTKISDSYLKKKG